MSHPSRLHRLLSELQRRRVFRVAIGYGAVAFATISVASDFLPALGLPEWTVKVVAWTLVLGFPVAVILSWIYDVTPSGIQLDDGGRGETAARGADWKHGRAAGLIGVGMLVAIVSVGMLSSSNALPFPVRASALPSIAALPFANVSDDPANDVFSSGMHEELLTQLYKLGGMTVISRTSVMQYRGTNKPLRAVAEELGVGAILEASVRREGGRVRITARLIDAGTDRPLWSETYDREVSDVLALQADLAEEIARALHARLTPAARGQLEAARRRTVDPRMYEIYLSGLFHAGEGRHAEAIEAYRRALQIDGAHAPAYAGLARSYYVLGFFGELAPGDAFGELARAAQRALELDPTLADAHATLALYRLHYSLDWQGADRLFRKALELSPNHAQVRHDYAHYLLAVGRVDDSVRESTRAATLDPANMMLMACAGWHGFTDREYDAAAQQSMRALMMMPDAFWPELILGWAYQHQGMHSKAIASLRNAVTHSEGLPLTVASLAHAMAVSGERTPALQLLDQLGSTAADRYVSAYDLAVVHAGLGNAADAFIWLRRAHAERSGMLINLGWDPRFDTLRGDPRFRTLVAEMRLPDRPAPKAAPARARPQRGM